MRWLGIGIAAAAAVVVPAAQEAKMLTFQAGDLRLGLDSQAGVVSLYDTRQQREYSADGRSGPLLELVTADATLKPTALLYDEATQQLGLEFEEPGLTATIAVEEKPTHLTFEVIDIGGATPTRINWGPFATTINETVGATVGVVRNAEFAIGIQSLNTQTIGGAAPKDYGSLLFAYAIEHDGGVKGSKVALFGCPAEKALETIGQIEIAESLPHPMLDGEWGKVSPTARRSYLIIPYGEQNIDEALEVAQQAGFTYVYHPGPFRTWGHFQLNPDQFPEGDASLKRCADRAAEVGIRLGLHTLSGFITTSDSYVTPVPDPRLARTGSSVAVRSRMAISGCGRRRRRRSPRARHGAGCRRGSPSPL